MWSIETIQFNNTTQYRKMAALLMAKRSIAIFTFMTIALVLAANANEVSVDFTFTAVHFVIVSKPYVYREELFSS